MLCGLVVSGLVKTLGKSGLVLGRDYEAVTVSISPTETPKDALTRKRGHLQNMGRTESDPDWAFLVGPKMSIDPLAKALGFQYSYDAATKQFAHAAVAMVISPEGKIARYLYPAENGLEFVPRDVKLAAVEAANGRVGTTLDRLILTCYQYDPAKRRYGPYALAFVRGGAILVLVALVSLLAFLWRQELKLKQRKHHREQQRRAPV
jgi:protein SCO1/2